MYLSKDEFKFLVSKSPLISIDISIVKDSHILLGERKNSPAKNYFFVPGGRIRKNERIDEAINRILIEELGYKFKEKISKKKEFIGYYEHFYEDNFEENLNFNTHYIVLAFLIDYKNIQNVRSIDSHLDQHRKYIWFDFKKNSPHNFKIHKYTNAYLNFISHLKGP